MHVQLTLFHEFPCNNHTAIDVYNQVQVIKLTPYRGAQIRNIPRPHLVGSVAHQDVGLCLFGLAALPRHCHDGAVALFHAVPDKMFFQTPYTGLHLTMWEQSGWAEGS